METANSPRLALIEPRYSFSESDYLANVSKGTSKRWLTGYRYSGREGERRAIPPVTPHRVDPGSVSFFDLIEVAAIGRLKARDFSLQEIRRMVQSWQVEFEVERPLAVLKLKVGGGEAYIPAGEAALFAIWGKRRGETAWREILEPFLDELEYDELGWATRWWPLGRPQGIVIDPAYAYGLPVVAGSGVRLEVIIERVSAGDLPDIIAVDFNLTREEVDRALQFELKRAA